jgi:hypothetical protein
MLLMILFLSSLSLTRSFLTHPHSIKLRKHATILQSTWQEKFDKFVDVDTACDTRRDLANDLVRSLDSIANDFISAIKDRNIEKIAPPNLTYGKNLKSAKAFREQLVSDIIPDVITNQIPKLLTDGPKIAKRVREEITVDSIKKQSEEIINFARDLSQDPSALQSTVDDLRKEVKNIFKSTPEGLQTPTYDILKSTITYEIREYKSYSVISTQINPTSSDSTSAVEDDMLATGTSFNELAGYILSGENMDSRKLAMTTPVIMGGGKMDFVLPDGLTAESAPKPKSSKLSLEDVSSSIVAVKQFSGIPTEKEVARQRAMLEDALLADGIIYDNLSFKTLTYNPPYTLPWLRRNEVSLKVDYKKEAAEVAEAMDKLEEDQ